ncbi:MAG: hypothetical protein IJK87_07575 [Prevotella sp.]|nr:hypothetical protein [Prevotella sp.]
MKYYLFTFALFACFFQAKGQNYIPDMTTERDFAAQVKSIDEFIARFNGDESKPDLSSDSLRRDNIINLFDFQMSHGGLDKESFKKLIQHFTASALNWKGKLSITGKGTYAEAKCKVKYKKKDYHITLIMKREKTQKGGQKWAIYRVKGLSTLGLYSDKRLTISPVDHETHFMSLQDFFQVNKQIVPSMRSNDVEIDELSFFFGLCVANAIEFAFVDELRFHFTDMPNYAFVVEEKGRPGTNSGWLITKVKRVGSESEREIYINELIGKDKTK